MVLYGFGIASIPKNTIIKDFKEGFTKPEKICRCHINIGLP